MNPAGSHEAICGVALAKSIVLVTSWHDMRMMIPSCVDHRTHPGANIKWSSSHSSFAYNSRSWKPFKWYACLPGRICTVLKLFHQIWYPPKWPGKMYDSFVKSYLVHRNAKVSYCTQKCTIFITSWSVKELSYINNCFWTTHTYASPILSFGAGSASVIIGPTHNQYPIPEKDGVGRLHIC